MTFLGRVTNSDERTELKSIFRSVGRVPLSLVSGTSVEMNIKFVSSNPDVYIFLLMIMLYSQNY
jgi:hypothetical protein